MFNNNEIKYNLYYIFSINFDNTIESSIVEINIKIKINTFNTLESS